MHSSPKTDLRGSTTIEGSHLVAHARECIGNAYAPYSSFHVGAAVLDEQGRIFTGTNVENASYGVTMCAERVAIFTAVAAGARRIMAVAVTAQSSPPVTPCGACRQVMAEFCGPETPIYCDNGSQNIVQWTFGELLPHAFGPAQLENAGK